jgi:hypothetical protein
MVANTSRFAVAIACIVAGCDAFSPVLTGNSAVKSFRSQSSGALFSEEPKDGAMITSGRKELSYDSATGRFFETDLDPEDCVPDDEYCVVDKASGELVRLTIEEKERIFLDALQVRFVFSCAFEIVFVYIC